MSELGLKEQVGALYVGHHGWLRNWLNRRLGDAHHAADLTHDTFVQLLARDEPMAVKEPRAFLTVIAQRVLANHWRRRQIECAYLEALAAQPEPLEPSPEERAIVLEALMALDKMLDGLPAVTKRAFLMTQLDDMTHGDVAQSLGISISTVKRHIATAAMRCYFTVER